MDHQRQPHASAFARFSDKLKETTKRVSAHHQHNRAPSREHDTLHIRGPSRDERRSSSASYTDKLRHMLTASPRPPRTGIDDLPIEVQQHIFLFLDFWSILRCQRVCKLWRDLVPGDSPLLQEALYLKPSRSLQIYSCVPATFEFDFDISVRSVVSGPQPIGSRFTLGVRKDFTMTRRCMGLIRTSSEIVFHPIIMDVNSYLQRSDFKSHVVEAGEEGAGAGSWRNMLVAMPPLRELRLRHGKTRTVYRVLRVSGGEDGIRLGDLFRVMDEWAAV
ncbi:uncharacterized protein K460DRAFT_380828 [Cucurbitaria berberidis CBS 394.84]|uniref:F-box domain-containing protein n=1 Tax=Cucurbitaria berberidis CBS 394.84 TaxID=1168544 RepID=A0A9P4L4P3_9PLEO|nr:uncharacterized protein K460DRAFT_380828 [Cucurbitaria berberidis CBS 394.84]KAF1841103.1 hypothetical protein K460DRAFT_380828 [Cucurbitaria berberidis CBS 394.84]